MRTKMNDHKSNNKIIQLNLPELIMYISSFVSTINSKFSYVASFGLVCLCLEIVSSYFYKS